MDLNAITSARGEKRQQKMQRTVVASNNHVKHQRGGGMTPDEEQNVGKYIQSNLGVSNQYPDETMN